MSAPPAVPRAKSARRTEPGPNEFWTEPIEQLLLDLGTRREGLTEAEAQSRLSDYGPNDAANERKPKLWLQFLARFRNPLVIILLAASGLSAATGDIPSFVIVLAIVMVSMTIDFVQESRAQNAVEALRRSVAVQATVYRNSIKQSRPMDASA